MKNQESNINILSRLFSRVAVILLTLALILSSALPMVGITARAETQDNEVSEEANDQSETTKSEDSQDESSEDKDAKADTKGSASETSATTISGYETYYNKRLNADLIIKADITPAGDREVQLQRYSTEEDSWATILTAKEAAPEETEDAVKEEDAATETEAQAESEAASEDAAAAEGQSEAVAEETPTTETEAQVEGEATTTETEAQAESETPAESEYIDGVKVETEDGVFHVSFKVPKEERMKTSSKWRIYVPASEKAEEAYSEEIDLITRNLESLGLSARNACVYRINSDGTGTMIYSKQSYKEVAQASTTKLMTAVLLLESGLIDSNTKISPHAASTPWGSGRLAVGDVYKTKDLLYAMLLPSANDAATAIAERVGGSESAFVGMMNAKAEEMGLSRTHFCNPHGLDADEHYTTALELARLTAYAYTFPEIRDCWATQYKSIKSLSLGRRWSLWSTNAIFNYIKNFLGGKTGTETNAGCCFTGVYKYNGNAYVTVVLGSGYGFSRWSDTQKLHGYIQDYSASSY